MSRNVFTSLRDTISDIAKRKHEAAISRKDGTPVGVEHSSDVYESSCAKIAAHFEPLGFRYAKSGPHFTKKKNGFTYKVSFQTSVHNIPGKHVSLSVAANVRSTLLKKWRGEQTHQHRKDDWVGGGLIHLLGTDLKYLSWELADPNERKKTIEDIIRFIESVALSYFECFDDVEALIQRFMSDDFPAMDIAHKVEFALCFGDKQKAQSILDRFVEQHSDLAKSIESSETEFITNGFPSFYLNKYADQVAFLRIAYGMNKGPNQSE